MILFTKAYTANGKTFATLEEAQRAELEALFEIGETGEPSTWTGIEISDWIVRNSTKIMDILTVTPSSRPAARKINGGRKPRKPKTETPAQPELAP